MLTREFISMVKNRSESKIVNISSSISRLPYSGMAVYGATKGFISSFSESLASELYGTNISVLCFHPGFTKTEFLSAANMDTHKTPQFLFRTPEFVASRIVKAIRKDEAVRAAEILGADIVFLDAGDYPLRPTDELIDALRTADQTDQLAALNA